MQSFGSGFVCFLKILALFNDSMNKETIKQNGNRGGGLSFTLPHSSYYIYKTINKMSIDKLTIPFTLVF